MKADSKILNWRILSDQIMDIKMEGGGNYSQPSVLVANSSQRAYIDSTTVPLCPIFEDAYMSDRPLPDPA